MKGLGLYIHIPFCRARCRYCDFASGTDFSREQAYFEALTREAESLAPSCVGRPVDTVYFGGGTPSAVEPERLCGFLERCRAAFELTPDCEITMECNPGTVTSRGAEQYLKAGFNRFSVGLQTAHDRTLKRLGRIYTAEEGEEAVRLLQRAGARNLSVDLMLGLPGEGVREVRESAAWALGMGIDHLSAYALTVEEGTPLAAEGFRVDEDMAADCYDEVCRLAEEAGLVRYEVSNFARPGFACRHNKRYWDLSDYLGLGVSAHSLIGDRRFFHGRSFKAYLADPLAVEEEERLTAREAEREYLMLALRTADGVDLSLYAARFGDFRTRYAGVLKEYADFLETDPGSVRLRPDRFYVMNAIIGAFWAAEPGAGEED